MADQSGIVNYLSNTSDTLSSNNYNEIDGLVMAQLSYYKFENMNISPSESYSIPEYAHKILNETKSLNDDQKGFLSELANSTRYQNCVVRNMQAENDSSQWAAITVDMNDGSNSSVVAMRGTDGTYNGWHEDFELLYDKDGTNAQNLSTNYLKNCDSDHIYMTGHSKGGNDVTSAYMTSPQSVRDRVVHIDNYDGPGVNDSFRDSHMDAYRELDGKLDNYYPEDSVIGHLLNNNPGKNHYVAPDVRDTYKDKWILGEHDPFAFKTDGNSFQEGKQSALSDYIDDILDRSVDDLPYDQRENLIRFIDKYGVFSLIAQKDTPFSDTKENVEKEMNKVDPHHLIPGKTRDDMADWATFIANVLIAVDIYKHMSPEEKEAAHNAIGSILSHTAERIGEDVDRGIKNVADFFVDRYNDVANWCKDRYDDAARTIHNINDSIRSKVDSAVKHVQEFFDSFNKDKQHHSSAGGRHYYGNAAAKGNNRISVNPDGLRNVQKELMRISTSIKHCENELESVLNVLPSAGIPENVGRIIRKKGTKQIGQSCADMGEKLNEIIILYESTEKAIVGMT